MKKLNLDIQRFSSTNKTTNYDLPQFVGTDKPTWLGDFNEAMSAIDAGMHENATDISSMESDVATASAAASQASQDVSTLTSTVNTLSTNVSTATTTANNAQATATSALNTANTANSTANTANGKADDNSTAITSINSSILSINSTISDMTGEIIWTNASPTASFSGQHITLTKALSNFDTYEVLYAQAKLNADPTNAGNRLMSTGHIPIGYGSVMSYAVNDRYRLIDRPAGDTSFVFQDASNGGQTDNDKCVPIYVIGYNTTLFNNQ